MIYPINTKIKIKDNHPHGGETGTVIGHELIMGKPAHLISLNNCQHGTDNCYVFNMSDMILE